MNDSSTPTAVKKTPFRRLGLTRSLKKSGTETSSTPTSDKVTPSTSEPLTPCSRPIKSTCSPDEVDESDEEMAPIPDLPSSSEQEISVNSPITPATSKRMSIAKRTRLNVRRRKILHETETYLESEMSVEQPAEPTRVETKDSNDEKRSSTKQKIAEIEATITVWQQGCVQALNNLQQLQGIESMQSLLDMLQIPHDLVNFDSENQEFLDPD